MGRNSFCVIGEKMSRYRQTMSEALKQVREATQKPYVSMSSGGQYNVLDKDGKTAYSTRDQRLAQDYLKKNYDNLKEVSDHEISMARGELEAIADKATQLASALQGKSDDGNPLEAWVQSKITKAKDYINSVSDYLIYNPDMKQNEEVNEKTYGWTLVSKAKDLAKKFANNMSKAVDEIEKLEKGLSKNPSVEQELRKYNEDTQRPSPTKPNSKELDEFDNYPTSDINKKKKDAYTDPKKGEKKIVDPEPKLEGRMSDIDAMRKKGASAEKIAKELGLSIKTVKDILGESNEDLYLDLLNEFSDAQVAQLKKAYDPLRGQRISGDNANKLIKIITTIDYNINALKKLVKADIPFVSDLAVARLISKHGFTADKIKPLRENLSEGTMKGGLMKYSGQPSSEYMKAKMAYKQFMSKPQPAKGAEDKVMPFVFDDQLLDDLYVASKKNVSDVRPMVKKRLQQLGFKESVNEGAKLTFETIQAVKNKAEKTGMSYSILKQVYDRGMAAWKGGHRPGATQQQWALARVNSFVTKSSGTWGGADSDLAAKVKGSKK